MAMRSWWRVAHRRVFNTLRCKSAKNDSIAALSAAVPTLPIDPTIRYRVKVR